VEGTRGSGSDISRARVWILSMVGWISSSVAFLRRRFRISCPSAAKGVPNEMLVGVYFHRDDQTY
jgi:hypothetical protein